MILYNFQKIIIHPLNNNMKLIQLKIQTPLKIMNKITMNKIIYKIK
jgi:hypothetical protein